MADIVAGERERERRVADVDIGVVLGFLSSLGNPVDQLDAVQEARHGHGAGNSLPFPPPRGQPVHRRLQRGLV